jgi:hypothetical protein
MPFGRAHGDRDLVVVPPALTTIRCTAEAAVVEFVPFWLMTGSSRPF